MTKILTFITLMIAGIAVYAQETPQINITEIQHTTGTLKADGSISITIEGGTAPYLLYLKDIQKVKITEQNYIFRNLEKGIYWIIIEDANHKATYMHQISIE